MRRYGGESVGACMHGLCSLCYGFWKHRKLTEVTRGRREVWVHEQFCLLERSQCMQYTSLRPELRQTY